MSTAHKTARAGPFLRGFTNSPWTGSIRAASTTTQFGVSGDFPRACQRPPEGGVVVRPLGLSETPDDGLADVLALFSLAWESRFPATETAAGRDSVRMGDLLPRKPEHLVLAGPFGRQVGETGRTVYPPKCDVERTVSATRPAMTRPLVCTENPIL
jgi:hypothetical protein